MSEEKREIHDVVRERYGDLAKKASEPGCCEPSSDCCGVEAPLPKFYDEKLLVDLPQAVTGFSLGCGDPVTIASLQPGERVLDLGSGGGIDCFMAARKVGEDGFVIGVDMTPAMIEKARGNAEKMGLTNVEFREGEIESLPVEDASIDIVMSNCVINLSPDKLAVFREIFRVLVPGGRISISDIVIEGEFSQEMQADASLWAGCVSGAIDLDVYIETVRAAGFDNVRVVDKIDAGEIVQHETGMPRIFSARIAADKPA